MTPEAQRIAVAAVMKWPKMQNGLFWVSYPDRPGSGDESNIIDDLNAMHEAEKVIEDFPKYGVELARVLGIYNESGWPCILPGEAGIIAHATAAQRAEAFLRTKGLWVE